MLEPSSPGVQSFLNKPISNLTFSFLISFFSQLPSTLDDFVMYTNQLLITILPIYHYPPTIIELLFEKILFVNF